MTQLALWQWLVLGIAAYGIGLSKTGIVGLGIIAVSLFAVAIPARESVGVVLPLLICGDVVAVSAYRRHAEWSHLWMLFPSAAAGIVAGFLVMDRLTGTRVNQLIGLLLIVLMAVQLARNAAARGRAGGSDPLSLPDTRLLAIGLGVLAGFATMVANAAGPIMVLYLLAARLPKLEFVGTGAWYFLVLNLFKVPFQLRLGGINPGALHIDAALAALAVAGALTGRQLLPHINQRLFESIAIVLTLAAGIKLLF